MYLFTRQHRRGVWSSLPYHTPRREIPVRKNTSQKKRSELCGEDGGEGVGALGEGRGVLLESGLDYWTRPGCSWTRLLVQATFGRCLLASSVNWTCMTYCPPPHPPLKGKSAETLLYNEPLQDLQLRNVDTV